MPWWIKDIYHTAYREKKDFNSVYLMWYIDEMRCIYKGDPKIYTENHWPLQYGIDNIDRVLNGESPGSLIKDKNGEIQWTE